MSTHLSEADAAWFRGAVKDLMRLAPDADAHRIIALMEGGPFECIVRKLADPVEEVAAVMAASK